MEIRILLADNQTLFRKALKRLLEHEPDFRVVADTDDGEQLPSIVAAHEPDVLLMDLKLLKRSGIEALREIAAGRHKVKPLLLTDTKDPNDIVQALIWGVRGFIRKDSRTPFLFERIRTAAAGRYYLDSNEIQVLVENLCALSDMVERSMQIQMRNLSRQQQQIVEAIVSGCTNRDIALQLSINERTVKYHLTRIFNKLGISGRMELARFSFNKNILPQEGD
jgi:DNA-binding NarL/FixJ family response regulator